MQENNNAVPPSAVETESAPTAAPISALPNTHRALKRLVGKRVKKFLAVAPKVGPDAAPKIVHDARVASRRLQQAISAFFPKPRPGRVRRLRRVTRRTRRTLGEWRNCDVLLEIVARQRRRSRSEAKRAAWDFVRDYLQEKRSDEISRATKKLSRCDWQNYGSRARRVLNEPAPESDDSLMQRLSESVRKTRSKWDAALARARETRAVKDLHAFRVVTKVLRYRTELLCDVGRNEMKGQLKWLADVQEALGQWHDRQMFQQAVAESVARAEILLDELPRARILLAKLEADCSGDAAVLDRVLRLAGDVPRESEPLGNVASTALESPVENSQPSEGNQA